MKERSEELDRELRRASTYAACKAYLDEREAYDEPLDLDPEAMKETLADLVCDLAHLADMSGLNNSEIWQQAAAHYTHENNGAVLRWLDAKYGEEEERV